MTWSFAPAPAPAAGATSGRRRLRRHLPGGPALVLAAALLAAPQAGFGQGIDMSQGGPVDVTARDGIEWRQGEQVVIARGDARAIRGNVTVNADRLLARYRPQTPTQSPPGGATPAAAPARPGSPLDSAGGSGGNEIWRLEAEGNVNIRTDTDTARGDRAVYDVDQAVLVLTGRDLGLKTQQQDITAKDSLEYWSQKRMAVARGGAVVVEPAENRRISADTLVAYFLENAPGGAQAGAAGGARPPQPVAAPRPAPAPGEREPPGSGRMDRVEAFGRVEIRTPLEVVRGDRAVYDAKTGMARLLGDVRITRGDNQVNGREAIVNMRTGVARLVSAPGARVQGLLVPEQQQPEGKGGTPEAGAASDAAPGSTPGSGRAGPSPAQPGSRR